MVPDGMPRADQAKIWADIDERFGDADKQSHTAAMSDLYEAEGDKLAGYEQAFGWQEGQVGAVFAIDGKPMAVEVFDAPDTFRKFLREAVGNFAMDAMTSRQPIEKEPSLAQVREFLAQMQSAAIERFPAVGEGEDLRIRADEFVGGALEAQGRVVHLSAFRV